MDDPAVASFLNWLLLSGETPPSQYGENPAFMSPTPLVLAGTFIEEQGVGGQ